MENLIETSKRVREEIINSHTLMDKLRGYVGEGNSENSLPILGEGLSNLLYSLGKTESGFYIATRETKATYGSGTKMKNSSESYARILQRTNEITNKKVSSFVIGVEFLIDDEEYIDEQEYLDANENKYILLLEDFKTPNPEIFEEGPSMSEYSFVDGEKVYHDFDESFDTPIDGYRFMNEEKMISFDFRLK